MTEMVYKVTSEDGDTINRIVADEAFVEAAYPGRWELVGPVPELPAVAPILPPLSRRRLRLGLLSIGIRAPDIEAVIAAIPDAEAREWAMIEWQDASEYERNHPLIADVAETLHLPAEQVDALWLWAAGL